MNLKAFKERLNEIMENVQGLMENPDVREETYLELKGELAAFTYIAEMIEEYSNIPPDTHLNERERFFRESEIDG